MKYRKSKMQNRRKGLSMRKGRSKASMMGKRKSKKYYVVDRGGIRL